MTEQSSPSFYDALGGADALHRLIDAFYDQVLQDPLLAPVFALAAPGRNSKV